MLTIRWAHLLYPFLPLKKPDHFQMYQNKLHLQTLLKKVTKKASSRKLQNITEVMVYRTKSY